MRLRIALVALALAGALGSSTAPSPTAAVHEASPSPSPARSPLPPAVVHANDDDIIPSSNATSSAQLSPPLPSAGHDAGHTMEEATGSSEIVPITIFLACLGFIVGTILRFFETQLAPLIRIKVKWFNMPPYTLSVFLVGMFLSVLVDVQNDPHANTHTSSAGGHHAPTLLGSVRAAQIVDPHVILLAFLPPLIFVSASHMNYHTFHRVRWQALLLAFPGVILQTFLAALCMRHMFAYGTEEEGGYWNWDVALTFGAIVCATDPVAVVATLHEIGAPEKISDVIDGESLLNDGSAMVVFGIFLYNVEVAATGGDPHTWGTGTAFFLRLAVGGVAVGLMFYNIVATLLAQVENDFKIEIGVLLVAVYACFSFSELVAGVSGVLAVVTFGLLMGRKGKYAFSPAAAAVAESVMPMLAHFSETMIFFVAGIATWTSVSTHRDVIKVWHAIPLYLMLAVVRLVGTLALYPLLRRTGYSINLKECVLIVYAGLRGAVGLALGLLVYQNKHMKPIDRDRIHFLVGSVVVLTMAINGTTTKMLYGYLALYPANKYRDVRVHATIAKLETDDMETIRDALTDSHDEHLHLYRAADWEIVRRMVPDFTGATVGDDDVLVIPAQARTFAMSTEVVRLIAQSAPSSAPAGMDPRMHHLAHIAKEAKAGTHKVGSDAAIASAADASATPTEPEPPRFDLIGDLIDLADFGGVYGDKASGAATDAPAANPRDAWKRAVKAETMTDAERRLDGILHSFAPAFFSAPLDPVAAAAAATTAAAERGELGSGVELADEAAAAPAVAAITVAPAAAPHGHAAASHDHGASHGHGHGDGAAAIVRNRKPHVARADNGRDPFGRPRRASKDCTAAEKRDEVVAELFRLLRVLLLEQYDNKQLDGAALSDCIEALSSGEEYLAEHPKATARAAFELELDVLLYSLPTPSPRWLPRLLAIPVVGRHLWRHLLFRRTYQVTEALAAFLHAHIELRHECAGSEAKMQILRDAVEPVIARCQAKLDEHRLRYWSLTTLQVNLLTARAAIDKKRRRVTALAHLGDLKHADEDALMAVLDSAMVEVDSIRYSLLAPRRFHRKLKLVLTELQSDAKNRSALASAK